MKQLRNIYISHDSGSVQHYLVVLPIQMHVHLGLRWCSHLAQLAVEIMLIGNFAAQRCRRKRRCWSRGWSFLVLLRWCAFPFAGGLVEVACLETWHPCCQPCVVLAGKMLFHL